jgi:hypothetical protein
LLRLEPLEDRTVPVIFTVTNTQDSGAGSLRQAILDANTNSNTGIIDTIFFQIAADDAHHVYYGNDGVPGQVSRANVRTTTAAADTSISDIDPDYAHSWWSIQPTTALPVFTDPLNIDGYTQPGAIRNGHTTDDGTNAVLRIELSGGNVIDHGLTLQGRNCTVRGLVVNQFTNFGILVPIISTDFAGTVVDNPHNTIAGDFVGTDVSGTLALGNGGGGVDAVYNNSFNAGILIASASETSVGTTVPEDRNLISGNGGEGITIADSYLIAFQPGNHVVHDNLVAGNLIGTDRTGTKPLGNAGDGIGLQSLYSSGLTVPALIGTQDPNSRNIISGNLGTHYLGQNGAAGSGIYSAGVNGVRVVGNYIGTNVRGDALLGNASQGIFVTYAYYPADFVIAGNLISGNAAGGIVVGGPGTQHVLIGGTAAGAGNIIASNPYHGIIIAGGDSNPILGNSIYSNAGQGIVLLNGANHNQAAPALGIVTGTLASPTITGTLATTPGVQYRVEVFASPQPANLSNSAGKALVGSSRFGANPGTVSSSFGIPLANVPAGYNYFSATATVVLPTGGFGDTSTFSPYLVRTVFTVTTAADDGSAGSLRSLLNQANTDAGLGLSDVIDFSPGLAGATLLLTQGQLELGRAGGTGRITLDGSGLTTRFMISGPGAGPGLNTCRVFQIDSGIGAELDGLVIKGGSAVNGKGGGILNSGSLLLNGCDLVLNTATLGGGGIYNAGTLATLSNCNISNNTAGGGGGGLCNGGTLNTVINCTLSDNRAAQGGGIRNEGTLALVQDCTLTRNTASFGGGISNSSAGTLSFVLRCTLAGNSADHDGGGIANYGTLASLNTCTLVGNSAHYGNDYGYGGGIYNAAPGGNGSNQLVACTLSDNSASYGGGIFNQSGGQLLVANGTLYNNAAANYGGGIANYGSLDVQATVANNQAITYGGGIYNAGTLRIGNSAVYANAAQSGLDLWNHRAGTLFINYSAVVNLVDQNPSDPAPNNGANDTATGLVASFDSGTGAISFKATVKWAKKAGVPTGQVYLMDGNGTPYNRPGETLPFKITLNASGEAVFSGSAYFGLQAPISAVYVGDANSNFASSTSAPLVQTVAPRTPNDLQLVIDALASSPRMAVTLSIDPTTQAAAINAVNNLTVSHPVTVVLKLGPGKYGPMNLSPPKAVTWMWFGQPNTVVDPDTPALTITSGNVIIDGITFTESGDAPTILVTGGQLTLRDSIVEESTNYSDPAIAVSGGSTVDLGTPDSPGGNTITVTGTGQPVQSTGVNVILAEGNTVQANGVTVSRFAEIGLTSSANPSLLNQSVTFTASVSAPAGSLAAPTGTVTFVDRTTGSTLAVVPVSAGSATWTGSGLGVNAHSIAALYSGDASYLNSAAALVQQVQYRFGGFLAPLNSNLAFGLNRTIPVKFQLSDANSRPVSSLSAVISLQVLNAQGADVLSYAGNTTLRYDASANQWVANWQTKGLPAGSYTVQLQLNDGTTYTKAVSLSANGGAAGLVIDGATATTAVGALLGGDVALYVDNSSGLLTSDELARIDAAVAAVDAIIGTYGVTITEVGDSAAANFVIDTASTSAVGSYADGVLGCTTDAGEITLIQGWDWYAGSDPATIGAGQYDFETVLVHELGHALGLGHSTAAESVMYGMLAAGAARRALRVGDLQIPDSDPGADALHAALVSPRTLAPLSTPAESLAAPPPGRAVAGAPSLAHRDTVFALLLRETLQGSSELSVEGLADELLPSHLGRSPAAEGRAPIPARASGGKHPLDPATPLAWWVSEGARPECRTWDLLDGTLTREASPALSAATDFLSAALAAKTATEG